MQSEEKEDFLTKLEALQEQADMVLFCGSVPPSFEEFYEEALFRCRGRKVIIDGRGKKLLKLPLYPFGVKMNREEGAITFGQPLNDLETFFTFFYKREVQVVILTLGQRGAILGGEEDFFFAKPPEVTTVNPVGSGDAFLVGFVFGLTRYGSLGEALRFGTAAGTWNAMVREAGRVERDLLFALAQKVRVHHMGKKLSEGFSL